MSCELSIEQLEKKIGRKLTKEEKEQIERLLHHNEYSNCSTREECIPA